MKLAVLCEYPLSAQGGVSVLVRELVSGFPEEWKILLVTPDTPVQALAAFPGQRKFDFFQWAATSQAPSKRHAKELNELVAKLKSFQADVTHIHCGGVFGWGNRWPGCSLPWKLKEAGLRSIWTNHLVVDPLHGYCGPNKPFLFKLGMLPFAWLGKLQQIAAVEAEICVSEHDARKIRSWYFPFRNKVQRIYHSRFEFGISDQPPLEKQPLVLSVGHVAFRKGQHVLARAFAAVANQFPEWKLKIVGEIVEDECANSIRRTIAQFRLQDRLILVGGRADAVDLMAGAAVFVQPSLQEALGLALQEALAQNCACIGTAAGGIPELIRSGENGLLVPRDDVCALAGALRDLMGDISRRSTLSQAPITRSILREMSRSQMLSSYQSVLGEATHS